MKLVVPPRTFPPAMDAVAAPTSTNVVDWVPFLYRRVLFPGRAEANTRLSWPRLVLLVLLSAVVVLPALDFALFEPDEGRYAQLPREMLDRGDWLVPVLQGEPYLDKPPLFYWLVMTSYALFGVADWSARLVPALAVVVTVLTVYLLGRRSLGERAAFWGALMLSLSPGLVSMGRILVLDGLLTLFVAFSLLAGFEATRGRTPRRGWWSAMSVALGLGTLTKGPIAILLVLPPLMAHVWLMRRDRRSGPIAVVPPPIEGRIPHPEVVAGSKRLAVARISGRALAVMAGIVAAVNLPWYVLISLRHPEFLSYFFWKHNLQRFLTPFDHEEPFWYFVPVLLVGLAPFVWLLPSFGRFLLSNRPTWTLRRGPEFGFFLMAGLWCVGFFSLSGSKLPTYILPAFPPLCLALGAFVTAVGWHRSRLFLGCLIVWSAILFVGHVAILPRVAFHRSPMNHPVEAKRFLEDRSLPIYTYPRPVNSVAFYLGRDDFQTYRSKELAEMLQSMDKHRRSVILFAHRNSKLILTHNVPPHFKTIYLGKLGLCDMAVVER